MTTIRDTKKAPRRRGAFHPSPTAKLMLAALAGSKSRSPFAPLHEATVPAAPRSTTIPPARHNGHLTKPDGRDILPPTRIPR